jgi:hypothetical protein
MQVADLGLVFEERMPGRLNTLKGAGPQQGKAKPACAGSLF